MLPWKPKVKHSDTVAQVTIFSFANTIKKVVAFGSSNTCFTKNANEDFGMLCDLHKFKSLGDACQTLGAATVQMFK